MSSQSNTPEDCHASCSKSCHLACRNALCECTCCLGGIHCCCGGASCWKCFKRSTKVLTGFFFLTLILAPPIIQIVAQTVTAMPETIILWVGVAQTILSALGAVPLGCFASDYGKGCCYYDDNHYYRYRGGRRQSCYPKYDDTAEFIFCKPCFNFLSMLSGGFTFYYLVPWLVINMTSSWYYINSGHLTFHWNTHLWIYLPILVYGPFFMAGCGIGKLVFKSDKE
jgi:hypothetical protein